jgi:hypothetical protein
MKKRIINMILNLILPEGAIVLTKEEMEALRKYAKNKRSAK